MMAYTDEMAKGTLYDKAASYMSWGIGKGFAKVASPFHGGAMGGGAASGGNWRTALEGQSPGCRDGPAPDMVCLFVALQRPETMGVCAARRSIGRKVQVAIRLLHTSAMAEAGRKDAGVGCGEAARMDKLGKFLCSL